MTAPTLSYVSPRQATPTIWLHYAAFACGVIPLAVGTIIFLLFLAIRDEVLAMFGLLTIFGGTFLAFIGFVCAGVYFYQAKRASPEDAAVARRQLRRDLAIIIANFPIAFVMSWIGIEMLQRM
jgi:hypothetical protein